MPRAFGAQQLKKLHQHTWCHWHRQLTLTIFGTLAAGHAAENRRRRSKRHRSKPKKRLNKRLPPAEQEERSRTQLHRIRRTRTNTQGQPAAKASHRRRWPKSRTGRRSEKVTPLAQPRKTSQARKHGKKGRINRYSSRRREIPMNSVLRQTLRKDRGGRTTRS